MTRQTDARVAILLATYNGEQYLDELIRSLFSQTYRNFVVIARDDHSSDRTPEILARWSAAQPNKINVVSDDRGNLRSSGNFSRLMELCDAPYFAFCDQDDVWLPNKIELAVSEIRRLERQFGAATPILVHSDLTVVDEDRRELYPSLFEHWQVNPQIERRLDRLIVNNEVTGCASMGNRALLELGRPVPEGVPHHDWWLALVAASCGIVGTIAEPTILYRQHGQNQLGAGPQKGPSTLWDARYILLQPRLLRMRLTKAMGVMQFQASVLLHLLGDKMPRRNRQFLCAFSLPRRRDEVALLPRAPRMWVFVQFLVVYARALPLALRWCR